MKIWLCVLAGMVLIVPFAARNRVSGDGAEIVHLPAAYVPPGNQIYKDYCAACHGSDEKGHGPVAESMTKRVPDLTTLAKRNGGKFPEVYVTAVIRFGPGFTAHGSSEMPVWGPIFQSVDNYNETAVRQRIKNLCSFLESIQEK